MFAQKPPPLVSSFSDRCGREETFHEKSCSRPRIITSVQRFALSRYSVCAGVVWVFPILLLNNAAVKTSIITSQIRDSHDYGVKRKRNLFFLSVLDGQLSPLFYCKPL